MAKIKPEFDKRNVKVIGLSVDPVESHVVWEQDIEETQGTAVNFPMIGDPDRTVADLYDMIHPAANDTQTVRSVFVIGPDKKVKLTLTYPASTGRNFDEILRVIDSLQLTAATRSPRRPTGSTARTSSSSRPSPTTRPRNCSRTAGTPRSRTSGSPSSPTFSMRSPATQAGAPATLTKRSPATQAGAPATSAGAPAAYLLDRRDARCAR